MKVFWITIDFSKNPRETPSFFQECTKLSPMIEILKINILKLKTKEVKIANCVV